MTPAHHRTTTGRLTTLGVAVLLCAGCHRLPLQSSVMPVPADAVVPFGAGYCETSWAPLMTVESEMIGGDIVYEESVTPLPSPVPHAVPHTVPLPSAESVDGDGNHAILESPPADEPDSDDQTGPPLSAAPGHRSQRVLSGNVLQRAIALEYPDPVIVEPVPGVSRSPSNHSSRASLSQLIQSNSTPVDRGDMRVREHGTAEDSIRRVSHVEAVLELLHSDSNQSQPATESR